MTRFFSWGMSLGTRRETSGHELAATVLEVVTVIINCCKLMCYLNL